MSQRKAQPQYLTDSEDSNHLNIKTYSQKKSLQQTPLASREYSNNDTKCFDSNLLQLKKDNKTSESNIDIQPTNNAKFPYQKICETKDLNLVLEHFALQIIDAGKIFRQPGFETKQYKDGIYFGILHGESRENEGFQLCINVQLTIGILIYQDGRMYEGGWDRDQKTGKGREVYPNGNVYQGEFLYGKKHGKGVFVWKNQERYDGEWKEGKKQGSGLWTGLNGDSYVGEWQQGIPNGYGIHRWVNGDRYEGQFKDCLKHGQGVEKFSNGDSYNGKYEQGKPSGYGIYNWANGNSYKGNFILGFRSGVGQMITKNEIYTGLYQNDKKYGKGTYQWIKQQQKYIGHFQNDLRHGYGKLEFKDGSYVEGVWNNGSLYQFEKTGMDVYPTVSEEQMQFKFQTKDNSIQIPFPPRNKNLSNLQNRNFLIINHKNNLRKTPNPQKTQKQVYKTKPIIKAQLQTSKPRLQEKASSSNERFNVYNVKLNIQKPKVGMIDSLHHQFLDQYRMKIRQKVKYGSSSNKYSLDYAYNYNMLNE